MRQEAASQVGAAAGNRKGAGAVDVAAAPSLG